MKIEAGKFYRTRNGKKAGPALDWGSDHGAFRWCIPINGHPSTFDVNGYRLGPNIADAEDLILEWYDDADPNLADSMDDCTELYKDLDVDLSSVNLARTPAQASKRAIYLSGPMKGYPSSNYPLFNTVAALLRGAGHRVYNPAEFGKDRPFEGFPIRQAFAEYSKFICEEADTIVLLPGWEASKGANAERALADNCGVQIIPFEQLSISV